ncbi:MAG: helix-turn-helix transcriptional regulator [Nitrospirae bacterium]|nr:helix-turn-helix transcriptional regulator [Nitrospirota bacterium]
MKGKDICTKIRELRKSLKLTQSQFAELVNLSEDSIGKIERGVTIPTIDTLDKIANGLKIPIEELISSPKEKSSEKISKAITDLTAYLKTHSSEDVRFIHELAVKILGRKK